MIATASTNAAIIIVIIVYLGSCCDHVAVLVLTIRAWGHPYIMYAFWEGRVLDLGDCFLLLNSWY